MLVVYRKSSEAEPYASAVEKAGAQPVLEEARAGLKIGQCSGLLLTGGTDVDPALTATVPPGNPGYAMRPILTLLPDRPSPAGAISRVVENVSIHS